MTRKIGAPDYSKTAGNRSGTGVQSILQHMHRDKRQRAAPQASMSCAEARSARTVLVVDDVEANRYALSRTLKAAGYNVSEASLGAEALKMASSASAVLLDVQLPDELGFAVCEKLRSDGRTKELPVILMSAVFVEESYRNRGTGLGADTYLVSPIDPGNLVEALDVLMGIRD